MIDADTSDEILASKAASGQEAFSQLYEKYLPKIFAFVSKRICDREQAEDIVSDIFVKVVENIKKFDSEKSKFKSWIYMIATRTLIDHFRTNKRTEDLELVENTADSATPTPHAELERKQHNERVLGTINRLPERHQKVLMLKFFSDLSLEELSEALGITVNNASVTINRALKAFKITYERYV